MGGQDLLDKRNERVAGGVPLVSPVRMKRLAVALMLALLAAALLLPSVSAHANLVRSTPAANSVLTESPQRVVMWFTEPMEANYSEAQVLDSSGVRIDTGDSSVDSNDPTVMSVGLPLLPNGTYTVAWRNLSTVDGHRIRGAFVFSVGEPISAAAADAVSEPPLFQTPSEPWIRWVVLLGALAFSGGLAFDLLVSRPVLTPAARRSPLGRLRARLDSRMRRMLWFSAIVLLLASAAQILTQAAAIGAPPVELLLETAWGRLWLWRIGLLLVALVLMSLPTIRLRAPVRLRLDGILDWLTLAASVGVLITLSLTSHAAATPGIAQFALANDVLHLIAASVWVGGLFALIVGTPMFVSGIPESTRRIAQSRIIRRFSAAAILSVCVLFVTGAFSAWAQVTEFAAIVVPYGTALRVKIALIVPLLLLGAVNLIWVRPRLRNNTGAARWLRRIVVAEAVLAVLIILVVGFLTSLEPARQVASRLGIGQPSALEFADAVDGAEIALRIEPAALGSNTLTVTLADALGEPIPDATDVRLRLSYLDADFGEESLSAVNMGGGRYVFADALISIAGAWQVEALIQRHDAFDARTAFRFEVTSGGSASIAPAPSAAPLYFGGALALLGFVFLAAGIPMGGWYNRAGATAMACGAVAFVAGVALAVNAPATDGTQTARRNPIPLTSDSVNAGQVLYERYCQSCHGGEGRGDGIAAATLSPPPADLAVHVPLHPEAALFDFIHDGIEGTAMTPLGDRLSEEEIWHVVNYIRTLAE